MYIKTRRRLPQMFSPLVWFGLAALAAASVSYGQGCVIARGGGAGSAFMPGSGSEMASSKWQTTVAHRWFRSDRHFAGREEHTHRQENQTEVINNSHFLDATLTYAHNSRWSYSLTLPFSWHKRSSLYEHKGNASGPSNRGYTQAGGLGDVRVGATYWVFDPHTATKGNLSVGFGFKAPTGDDEATDLFHRTSGDQVRFVDSSIQPGDGGWGATLEVQAFRRLNDTLTGYLSGFYLFNPETRNVNTQFSIPDAYLVRFGVEWRVRRIRGLGLSMGPRWEGVPSRDALGHSAGSRRPGYAISVEPGVTYARGRVAASVTVPIALERNRQRTYGATRTGDAAFADYTVNSSISYGF